MFYGWSREAVVLYCVGIPLMMSLGKNETIRQLLELNTTHLATNSFITLPRCLSTVLEHKNNFYSLSFLERVQVDSAEEGFITFTALALSSRTNMVNYFLYYRSYNDTMGAFF